MHNWTNPWEGSSDDNSPNTSPATLPPNIDLNVDARPAGAGGQKDESFDNGLMSPLSPLRSADASPNEEDWTNPWEVCLRNTYRDKSSSGFSVYVVLMFFFFFVNMCVCMCVYA